MFVFWFYRVYNCLIIAMRDEVFSFQSGEIYGIALSIIAVLATIIPATDIAVNFVNWVLCKMIKPSLLPKLDFENGIPEEYATMVVIPALLPDENRARELIDNLEVYYLANREKNLYFSIAGDFKDAPNKEMAGDKKIIETALGRIAELNEKYGRKNEGGEKTPGTYFIIFIDTDSLTKSRTNGWDGREKEELFLSLTKSFWLKNYELFNNVP